MLSCLFATLTRRGCAVVLLTLLWGLFACGQHVQASPTPYGGAAVTIAPGAAPVRVEAERYDLGGEGVAFHDYDNGGQTSYRADNIGVVAQGGTSGGYVLGWQDGGEWEGYTLNVTQGGAYTLDARVSCAESGHTFHLEFGPVGQIGGYGTQSVSFSVPNTGGPGTFQDVYLYGVYLNQGTQWMRLVMDGTAPNVAGFDYISFASAANDNANFPYQSVPLTMTVGQSYPVSVTMTNTGQTYWSESNLYRLASANPYENQTWRTSRVLLLPVGTTVVPNLSYSFQFTVTAPPTPGTYNWQWRMVHEAVGYFGQATPNLLINVVAPPVAPTSLTATAGNAQVSLSWTNTGAASYNLYRGTTPNGEAAAPVRTGLTANAFTDTGLTNGTTYYYKVTAVNAAGTESARSNEASATPRAPDFSLSASPSSVSVAQGGSGISTVTVTSVNGFTGTVSLVATNRPTGVTVTFNPASVAGGGSSTATISVPKSIATGTYTVTVQGTSGTLSHTTTVTLTVTAGANQAPTVSAGANQTVTLPNTVSLSGTAGDDGLPNPPATLTTIWSKVSGPGTVTFGDASARTTTASFSTAGAYVLRLSASDGALTSTSDVTITVNPAPDFSLSANPSSLTITQGGSGQSTITVTSSGGFSGSVALTASGLPSGATASFSPQSTTTTSTLTLTASGTAATGTATVTITGNGGGLTRTTTLNLTVTAAANQAPTVATPASASPNPVTGTTTALSVLGADDGGEAALTYTWSATGPAPVTFSANSTNAAKNTTATFTKAGAYTFQVVIADAQGLTATSAVSVTVNQTTTTITVSPASASVPPNGTQQFTASATDQFGSALSPQPAFTWTVNGGGVIDSNGLFTAGSTASGSYTVTATAVGQSGVASVTVAANAGLETPNDLAAYATGSGKITLYWSGVSNATGYNVYRGTTAGGEDYTNPVNGSTPVTTQDTGPGVTNTFQFADNGLMNGQEYFYTVTAVYATGESVPSNEDSDTPDPDAVPWDSGNPSAILSAFRNAFASDVANVGTGGYALRVVGPDNVTYDDSYSIAQPADGTFTPGTNQFVRSDGTSLSLPDDLGQFDTPSGPSPSNMAPRLVGTALPASKGPYRRVRTTAEYRGESGMVTLPSPMITATGKAHGDTAMIFLGASGAHTEVDTGLQYSTKYGDWEMFMNISGRYVGTGKKPIPPTHLLNIPDNFIHVPSGDAPSVSYWAWGRLPSATRAKLSLLLVDDGLYGGDAGALGAASKYLGKTENVRAKRVHAIAQNAAGVYPTGSRMDGASWSQGYVVLTDNAGTLQGWNTANGTHRFEDGSYEGGHSNVSAIETSPYIAEDNISIDIGTP